MAQHTAPVAPPRTRVVVQLLAGCAVAAVLLLTGAHTAPAHSPRSAAAQTVTPTSAATTAAAPGEWNSGGA